MPHLSFRSTLLITVLLIAGTLGAAAGSGWVMLQDFALASRQAGASALKLSAAMQQIDERSADMERSARQYAVLQAPALRERFDEAYEQAQTALVDIEAELPAAVATTQWRESAARLAADAVRELNESFSVILANPSEGAAIGRATATAAIIDDDTILVLGATASGTDAADYFLIGAGDHSVSGLAGTDRFAFLATAQGTTTLSDFTPAAGERIDLSRIDAIAATLANDAFTFVASFSGIAGQLAVGAAEAPGQLLAAGDTNGDMLADFRILLPDLGAPQQGWFIL